MSSDQLDRDTDEIVAAVKDELADERFLGDKVLVSRRELVGLAAGSATVAGLLGHETGTASAQSGSGTGRLGDPTPLEYVGTDSLDTDGLNNVEQVTDGRTIQGVHDGLPSGGGVIEVTPGYNPADETLPISITKPVTVVGPGSDNPDGELDFSGDSTNEIFDVTLPTMSNDHENAVEIAGLRLVGGSVGIAITDLQFGCFRDLVIHNSGVGIEYRNGDQVNFGNKFYDVDIFGCGTGVATNGSTSNPDANAFFGCTVRDTTGNPLDIRQGYQFKWIGGMIEKNDGHIYMEPQGDAHLWGVYIEENDKSTLTRDVEWRADGGTIIGCRFQGVGNNDRALNPNFCEDADAMFNNFVGYVSGFVQVNGNASDFNLSRNHSEDGTPLIAADSGVRTRFEGVIGGGPLGGVDLSTVNGQYEGDRAVADGTSTAAAGDLATWDDAGTQWRVFQPSTTV